MWSCGVIMYFLLCGHPPFVGSTEKRVLERVLLGAYDFNAVEWADITDGAKDLIKKMLEYNSDKRLTAEAALNDPWFSTMLGSKSTVSANTTAKNLKNLQKFHVIMIW